VTTKSITALAFVIGALSIATLASAETATVSTLGTIGDNAPWSYSYVGVVTQPGPTYNNLTFDNGAGTAVNVTPNGAWTGANAFVPAPGSGQSWWISTEADTLAPSSVISFDYQLTGFSVDSGDIINYSFEGSADNAIVGVEFVQSGNVIGVLYPAVDWQASPPPASYFFGFQGSIVISGSGTGLIAPPPISVEFDVLNEADNNVYTSGPTSPAGLAVTGSVTDDSLTANPVPLPSSLAAGMLLIGVLAMARRARRLAA
jgi:hypothetical protein